jgi:hypothetical protein
MAAMAKSTVGWFYVFKLHIVINGRGEIINCMISQGNMDDKVSSRSENFLEKIFGKFFMIWDISLINSAKYFSRMGYNWLLGYVTT